MKKIILLLVALSVMLSFSACKKAEYKAVTESFENAGSVLEYLSEQNGIYVSEGKNSGNISTNFTSADKKHLTTTGSGSIISI